MNTTTKYLGLTLPHPFIAGASPLADTLDNARRVEDGGSAAIVMRSLFEEQINAEAMATHRAIDEHADSSPEAGSYFPDPAEFAIGPGEYLEQLARVKKSLKIPVIGSLNGFSVGGWLEYAKSIQQAGADALELNVYYIATNPNENANDIEQRTIDVVRAVTSSIRIPVAVKLSPFYTALPNFAKRLEDAGAAGLVLFNRFFETDIDIEALSVLSQMHLSDSRELLLRLRWLAILSAKLNKASLAVSGGVHTTGDAVKAVMSGASAIQLVASLLHNGPARVKKLRSDLETWLTEKEYDSLEQMRGSMNLDRSPNAEEYTRGNYMKMIQTWNA